MPRPQVSVIMAVHNGERYLREAMESLLCQSLHGFEFIAVDDGSTDGTGRMLEEYGAKDSRVVLLCNKHNVGLTASLNRALSVARGELIARQDADDVSSSDRFALQAAHMKGNPGVGLLGTAYHVVDARGERIATHKPPVTDTEIRWQMLFHNAFCHSSVMVRRSLLQGEKGPYDERLPFAQDYDLWDRLLQRTHAANLTEPLVCFRTHDESIASRRGEEQGAMANGVSARALERLSPRHLDYEEVRALRCWYREFPGQLEASDLALCLAILDILDTFGRRPEVDPRVFRRIRGRWRSRVLSAVPLGAIRDGVGWARLASFVRDDPASLIRALRVRLARRVRPAAREVCGQG